MFSTKELRAVVSWLTAPMIRQAVDEDAAGLLAYFQALAADEVNNTGIRSDIFQQTVEEQRTLIRRYAHAPNSRLFVLDADGKIAGLVKMTGSGSPKTSHTVALSLNVHPDYRGAGFGSALLRHALSWAYDQESIRRVELDVLTRNEGALRLYQRFGFQVEGRRRKAYYLFDESDDAYVDVYVMAALL